MNFQSSDLKKRIILRRIIQTLIVLAIFVMAVTPIKRENDIYWQLRMGEDIVKYHYFPVRDPYSLPAAGEVWTLHEWIPSVMFFIINSHFGSAGLVIFKALIVSATFGIFMLLFNRIRANLYLSVLVFALAALVNTRGIWVVFPSIFEYLFLALTFYLLEIYRRKAGKVIPVVLGLLSLIWTNSHGSFFLLPLVVGTYVVGDILADKLQARWTGYKSVNLRLGKRQRWTLFVVVLVALVAPLITPNGAYETYLYPLRISLGRFTSYVSEYQHFWVVWHWDWSDFVHGFTLILMSVLALLFLISWRRLHPSDLALGVIFSLLAMLAVRHVAIFGLAALFLIVRYLVVYFGEYRGIFKRSFIKDILLIFMIISVTFYYKTKIAPFGFQWIETDFPKAAAELIVNNKVSGNMFNHYNYGGYLIWKMRDYKVFMDGRLEMYQGKAGEDYLTILLGRPGERELIEKYKINFFILYLTDPIIQILAEDPKWKYVYHDSQYVVFVKDAAENAKFLSRNWSAVREEKFRQAYRVALKQYWGQWLNQKGLSAVRRDDLVAALVAFDGAVKYDPKSVSARLNLAQALVDLGMYQEAKKEYEFILLALDPKSKLAKRGLETAEELLKSDTMKQ